MSRFGLHINTLSKDNLNNPSKASCEGCEACRSPTMLYEDEVTRSRSGLQRHKDRLTDISHEQTCQNVTLTTVTRELGLSHEMSSWKSRISQKAGKAE